MSNHTSVDVAILGAGIAGCHLAQLLAHTGISVALIDHLGLSCSGPDWINAVPLWMFDEAGLEGPQGQELFDLNERFIVRAPDQKTRVIVDDLHVADVHMGQLGKRLKEKFVKGKVGLFLHGNITSCQFNNDRLTKIAGESQDLGAFSIQAPLFVDASGIKAILRKSHPQSSRYWPLIASSDMCTAAQRTLEIKDPHGALTFLEKNNFAPGDILADVGFMGGYSLFRIQIDKSINHISILCGIRALPEFLGAQTLVSQFVGKNAWIGKVFIDGRGVIPIKAPYRKLTSSGLALIGDAACQVYAAHGSGIGIGLIAAKMLADSLIAARYLGHDLGGPEALGGYQRAFHQRYYRRLYFSEHFRKFSQSLKPESMIRLIESGMLSSGLLKQTLLQLEPELSISDLRTLSTAAIKSPRLFASILPALARAPFGGMIASRLGSAIN